jgi:hypothetical protein
MILRNVRRIYKRKLVSLKRLHLHPIDVGNIHDLTMVYKEIYSKTRKTKRSKTRTKVY